MSIKNRKLIIDLLNEDIQGEHGAIIQYLYHAWTLDMPGVSGTLESIARDEMRHLQWLSQRVVELGGNPSIARYPVYLEAPTPPELMNINVKAEDEAISQYRRHISEIEDEQTIRLLERIIMDEEAHQEQFTKIRERIQAAIEAGEGPEPSPEALEKRDQLIEMLNAGVKHEYTVILQYLHQSFTAQNPSVRARMDQASIIEMKHMGWLAERVAELGGKPTVDRNKVVLAETDLEMIQADIADEEKAVDLYEKQIQAMGDPEDQALLNVIKKHEIYHLHELTHLIEVVKENADSPPAAKRRDQLTVGSLIKE